MPQNLLNCYVQNPEEFKKYYESNKMDDNSFDLDNMCLDVLKIVCEKGNFDILCWLTDQITNNKFNAPIYHNIGNGFLICCKNSHLKLAKYSYDNVSNLIEKSFYESALQGCKDIDIFKWLFDIIDINENKLIRVFAFQCENGHDDIVKYLYNTKVNSIGINKFLVKSFIMASSNGHIELTKWLEGIDRSIIKEYM